MRHRSAVQRLYFPSSGALSFLLGRPPFSAKAPARSLTASGTWRSFFNISRSKRMHCDRSAASRGSFATRSQISVTWRGRFKVSALLCCLQLCFLQPRHCGKIDITACCQCLRYRILCKWSTGTYQRVAEFNSHECGQEHLAPETPKPKRKPSSRSCAQVSSTPGPGA